MSHRSAYGNWLIVIGLTALICTVTGCFDQRTVDDYLAEAKAIGEPDFDASLKEQPGYMDNYRREQHELYRQKAALLLAACRSYPHDERVPDLMNRRWKLLGWNQDPLNVADEVLADINATLPDFDDSTITRHADYWGTYFRIQTNASDAPYTLEQAMTFSQRYPDDERGARLLDLVASGPEADSSVKSRVWTRLSSAYQGTYYGTYAPGLLRRLRAMGQPFDLSFTDAISGRKISLNGLKGHVVVVDFWSTACVPCVQEMPHLKELYAEYHPKGVEFVGISLDEPAEKGGRDALHSMVERLDIPWPQYYQGHGYDSEFSKSWGVGSIPTMFVIDAKGRLYSTDARGKLPNLLSLLVESS